MKPITATKYLSDKERDYLINFLNKHKGERDSIMLRLQLYTGARKSEILLMTVNAFSNNSVTIKATKGSNDRTVPLKKEFYSEILLYIINNNVKDKLFPISSKQYSRIWDLYRPTKKGTHTLRHTFGILLYKNSKDIHMVKKMLGHKSITNTMVYLDFAVSLQDMRQAVKGMWNQDIDE
jgi:integrase